MARRLRSGVLAFAGVVLWLWAGVGEAASLPGYDVWTYQHVGAPVTGFRDINAVGDMVGYYQTDAADFNTANALQVVSGVATTINPPGSTGDRRAFGNNDVGDAAGSYDELGQHGFVLSGGVYTQVDYPGTTQGTTIRGLNNLGDLAGEYDDAGWVQRGFVRVGGVYLSVSAAGASSTTVRGLNDGGRMVGFYVDGAGALRGYVSDDGVVLTPIDRPGAAGTLVGGINNAGVIVGASLASAGPLGSSPASGFLYEGGMFRGFDLMGASSTLPIAINDVGQVAGEFVDMATGLRLGFVATPWIAGDANGDGVVDLLDFDVLAQNFGATTSGGVSVGDFNADGVVDLLDFDILAQNFGASSPAVVPEPAGVCCLVLGFLARGVRRGGNVRPLRRLAQCR